MQMTFEASSSVTLLFDFWAVHGPPGMVLSVLVVCLFTIAFEFLKMWRIWLGCGWLPEGGTKGFGPDLSPPSEGNHGDDRSVLAPCRSQSSLDPIQPRGNTPVITNRWLLHSIQTGLHVFQVALGYMIMLCVMSYNVWIFLGVLLGSGLGYFLAYPLIGQMATA